MPTPSEPSPTDIRLELRPDGVVAVADDDFPPLTAEQVRDTLEETRRLTPPAAGRDGRAVAGPVGIEFFDVPPEEDEEFLAAWAAEGGGVLFRAIRDDARCRFVAVTAGGDYELVREDGAVQASGGVVLIHEWKKPPDLPTGRRGYIGSRLYRGAEGYVEIAWWSSPLMVFRAKRPGDLYVTATPSRTSD